MAREMVEPIVSLMHGSPLTIRYVPCKSASVIALAVGVFIISAAQDSSTVKQNIIKLFFIFCILSFLRFHFFGRLDLPPPSSPVDCPFNEYILPPRGLIKPRKDSDNALRE